jgi:transposase
VRGGQPMDREYIGIDLHKAFFQACALTATGERLWEGRFPRTPEGVARFIARGVDERRAVAVEATGPTWAFVDAITPTGATVCVVDPRKTKLKAGFAAKTDRLDARRLADALRRESVVSIYIPPPAIRELREMCRGRHQVVRLRTRLAQMIRALLLRCDAGEPPGTRLYAPRALVWLAQVQRAPEADRTLRRLARLYREVHTDAHAADAELKQRATADPIAMALTTMTGIGPVVALTLRAEIGDIGRFRRGPELACYAGLVPRVDRSAGHVYHGRITRAGSPWLRWALVEAALHAIKRPDATGRWARRVAVRKGIHKARVALARVLCDEVVATWPRLTSGV